MKRTCSTRQVSRTVGRIQLHTSFTSPLQVIFLNCLFGYLIFLIIFKWVSGSTADLYHVLIYMFLSPGDAGLTCNGDCMENRLFFKSTPIQGYLQVPPSPIVSRCPAPHSSHSKRQSSRFSNLGFPHRDSGVLSLSRQTVREKGVEVKLCSL